MKACIDQKCHYIDVSGETYVRKHLYVVTIINGYK